MAVAKPKKRGRPKLEQDERLAKNVKLRCTESDHATIVRNASKARLSVSDYLRQVGTRGKVQTGSSGGLPAEQFAELQALGVELRRWGNNLNQIAKEIHTERGRPSDEIETVCKRAALVAGDIERLLIAELDAR